MPSFSKAEQAGAPCVTGSARMVACVALDGDMLLEKPCPRASGQSPALTCFWGGRASLWAVTSYALHTRMGIWKGPAIREG